MFALIRSALSMVNGYVLCVSIQFEITLNQIIHGNVNYTSTFFSFVDAFCVAFICIFPSVSSPHHIRPTLQCITCLKQEILKPDEVSKLQNHFVCHSFHIQKRTQCTQCLY